MTTHIEAQRTRDGWKLKATLGTAAIFAVVVLAFLFRLEAGIIALGMGSVTVWRMWVNGWRTYKHTQLDLRERAAEVGVAEEKYYQERILTHQLAKAARIHETRIGVFIFGSLEANDEPTYFPATAGERKILQPQLAAPEPKPDLLKVFTQEQATYAILGAQRSGKTYQAMHFADYWLVQGHQPVVIGMKRKAGEWQGCKCRITEDATEIDKALQQIVQFSRLRHADNSKAKTPLPVFLDDWLWIVQNCGYAEQFMSEAGTVMASANIIIYLILQSDSKDAFGIRRYGAMLKRNYQRLYLHLERDKDGVIIPGRSSGYLIYPGESEANKQEVDLLSGVPRCVELRSARSDKARPANAQATIELAEQNPGNWQAKTLKGMALLRVSDEQVIKLYDEGMTTPTQIVCSITGWKNGKPEANNYVRNVLEIAKRLTN